MHFTGADFDLLYLAVSDGPLIQPSTYQYKSAKLNHNSAGVVCRGHRSGVTAVSVPLVNNRKGSLLPIAEPSTLRLSFMGSRDLGQVCRLPGVAEEASRLHRARSMPVKYRYHPSHSNNATLSHRHCKGHPPPPPTSPRRVCQACTQQQHNQSMCLPGWSGCMCSIPY